MKTLKICIMLCLLVSVGIIAQAQQSAFQGTWIGDKNRIDRSDHKIVISGTNWSYYYRNEIQAGGTAKFSAGQALLLLANGETYFNLTLLAPGIIEQPDLLPDYYYRFKLTQSNNSNQSSSSSAIITENIFIEGIGQLTYNMSNNLSDIENAVLTRTGYIINLRNTNWDINTVLSPNVKTAMNKHNVNYSITISDNMVVINKRDGNNWYVAIYK